MARFIFPFSSTDDSFIPLPSFLTYEENRSHLPVLNENFGWDNDGVWFGPTTEGEEVEESYPIFTNFTIPQNTSSEVSFDIEFDAECSDAGVAFYVDGTTPVWNFSPDLSRISAQFNCPVPEIQGLETFAEGEGSLPGPGIYRMAVTYDPTAETDKVVFEVSTTGESPEVLYTLTLDEALPEGDYRIGFSADMDPGDGGRTYIRNLAILAGEDTYMDSLTEGNSGTAPASDIADFVFTDEGEGNSSTITISNKDMNIQTIRDNEETDADISITAADDIFIEALGDDLRINAANEITLDSYNAAIVLNASEGEFLGDSLEPLNQIAVLGDIGVETSYEVQGGTAGTQPTFNGDPLFTASYIKMSSNLVHFEIQVDMDNIESFGTGQYYMTLPFNSKYGYKFRDGCLHDIDDAKTYHISGHVNAGSNVLTLFTTDLKGQNLYDFPFAQGEPITLSTVDNFHIAGTYICE